MAGAAPMPSVKSARKALDAALNLVPFIDLLSCCIAFLLITAVWSQVGQMPVTGRGGTHTDDPPPTRSLPSFTLHVGLDGYLFSRSTGEQVSIPRRGGALDDETLRAALGRARADAPDQLTLTIEAEDALGYDDLVHTMDVAAGAHFLDLEVRGTGAI